MLKRLISISAMWIAILTWWALPALAEMVVDTAWVRRYDGAAHRDDYCFATAIDSSGCVYVTGCSWGSGTDYDYTTIKYYPNGDIAWVRRYDGPEGGSDYAYAIALYGCENIYVAGTSGTIKYTSDGSQVWTDSLFDGRAVTVDDSGSVYVTGPSGTVKYDANGNQSWVGAWGEVDIGVDTSHNVYVTGGEVYYETVTYYPDGDTAWLRKYDESVLWDHASGIDIDDAGNVYVTGTSLGSLYEDYATIKYDANGDTLWIRRYDRGRGDDCATAIAVDASGNVYVTGYGYSMVWMNTAYVTIKYDSAGNPLWVRHFNVYVGRSKAYALALDSLSNVYVTGSSNVWGYGDYYTTVGYDSSGNLLWVERYDGPGNLDDVAYAIALDGSGNVYVTGWSWNGRNYDYATIKYVQTGRWRGDANGDDVIDIADVIYLINYLFIDGSPPDPLPVGDCNCDEVVDIADVMYLINYLFIGGSPPHCWG